MKVSAEAFDPDDVIAPASVFLIVSDPAGVGRTVLPDTDEALNPPSPRLQSQQAEGELTSSRPVRSDPLLPVIINNNLEYYAG